MRKLLSRLKKAIVGPVPPELDACEVCGQLKCSDGEWRSCEKRIATAEFIRKGDDAALARLKDAYGKKPGPSDPPPPKTG